MERGEGFLCLLFFFLILKNKCLSLPNLHIELVPVFPLKLFRKSYWVSPYSYICSLKLAYLETNSEIFLLWFWNPFLTPSRASVSLHSQKEVFPSSLTTAAQTETSKLKKQITSHGKKKLPKWDGPTEAHGLPLQPRKPANPSVSYLCLSKPHSSKLHTPLTCFLISVTLCKLNCSSPELNRWIERQHIVQQNGF